MRVFFNGHPVAPLGVCAFFSGGFGVNMSLGHHAFGILRSFGWKILLGCCG